MAGMYMTQALGGERRREMLAEAAAGRTARRVRALGRATRQAERARRRLHRSRAEVIRLRGELAQQ